MDNQKASQYLNVYLGRLRRIMCMKNTQLQEVKEANGDGKSLDLILDVTAV